MDLFIERFANSELRKKTQLWICRLANPELGKWSKIWGHWEGERHDDMYNIRKMGQIVSPIAYFLEGQ